jgi:catechol 2,3-dioxygenase-like lactoylglutathione lyase family enzyme
LVDLQASDIRTFVPARDFEASKDFYGSLGFTLKWSDANLALLEIANQRFYLQRYYVKEWAENSMIHITVADARSCFRQITELLATGRFPGARVSEPKQEKYGALVTYVWDPAGVLLHLAQWTGEAGA